jgi:hypothetical protein
MTSTEVEHRRPEEQVSAGRRACSSGRTNRCRSRNDGLGWTERAVGAAGVIAERGPEMERIVTGRGPEPKRVVTGWGGAGIVAGRGGAGA